MPLAVDLQGGVSNARGRIKQALARSKVVAIGGGGIKTMQRYWERTATKAEQRVPELAQQTQPSGQTAAFDDGNGAAAYADPATQEFAAERSSRLRRDG
jgi:hypothetical protein